MHRNGTGPCFDSAATRQVSCDYRRRYRGAPSTRAKILDARARKQ